MEGIVIGLFSFMSMFGCIYNREVQHSMFMLDRLNISPPTVSFLDGRIWLKCAFATIVMTKVLELYLAPTCLGSQLVPVIMGIFLETKLAERTTTPSKDKHNIQRDHSH